MTYSQIHFFIHLLIQLQSTEGSTQQNKKDNKNIELILCDYEY